MKEQEITPELLADLSCKVEGLIELEVGVRLPYISLIFVPGTEGVALFTNRKSDREVLDALEQAIKAIRRGQTFRAIDGKL